VGLVNILQRDREVARPEIQHLLELCQACFGNELREICY
jgi:hypothetical protein